MYQVIKTACFPHEWFGGPTWNGQKLSNSTYYFWKTREEAQTFCDRMNKRLCEEDKTSAGQKRG